MYKLPLLALTGAAAIALSAPTPAQAASSHLLPGLSSVVSEANVIEVRDRGRHHRHHGRHYGRHRGNDGLIALGIGSAIVGGLIASQQPSYGYAPAYGPQPYGYAGSGWDECAARFRSLRADGTYTTYDGRQVLCPYLR